jgi:hypothetical protein
MGRPLGFTVMAWRHTSGTATSPGGCAAEHAGRQPFLPRRLLTYRQVDLTRSQGALVDG